MTVATEIRRLLKKFGLEWFNKYYACYRGFVADNADPEFSGRLKLKVPQVYGDQVFDYWAGSKGMFAGNRIGLFAIPNIGDGVWVSFENGDPYFPIWEYGWFADKEVPEAAKVDGDNPKNMIWQSTSGNRIELDDHNELVRITDKHGNIVELNKNGVSIVTDKISLGTLNKSSEPAVLGDKLVSLLNDFITDFGNVGNIITNTGVTQTLSSSPQWSILANKWKGEFKKMLSKKATLD